jgi:hypothetical protein
MIPVPFLNRDLHILQGLKVKGLLSWLSQDTHPAWLLPELRVRVFFLTLHNLRVCSGREKILQVNCMKISRIKYTENPGDGIM